MTQTDKLIARKEAGVGIVTFNNPERHNAVSLEMWEATTRILNGFAADNDIRVVVLTGAGGKAFVSGADISKFESERVDVVLRTSCRLPIEHCALLVVNARRLYEARRRGQSFRHYCRTMGNGLEENERKRRED